MFCFPFCLFRLFVLAVIGIYNSFWYTIYRCDVLLCVLCLARHCSFFNICVCLLLLFVFLCLLFKWFVVCLFAFFCCLFTLVCCVCFFLFVLFCFVLFYFDLFHLVSRVRDMPGMFMHAGSFNDAPFLEVGLSSMTDMHSPTLLTPSRPHLMSPCSRFRPRPPRMHSPSYPRPRLHALTLVLTLTLALMHLSLTNSHSRPPSGMFIFPMLSK